MEVFSFTYPVTPIWNAETTIGELHPTDGCEMTVRYSVIVE